MKAIVYNRFGGPEVLAWQDAPEPKAGNGQVIVSLRASSLNVLDIRTRDGKMAPFVNKKFPKIAGIDVAGIVADLGEGVAGFKVGQRVFGAGSAFAGGAFAEKVAVPATGLAEIPEGLGFEAAATLPTTGLAALMSVRDLGKAGPGKRVLIHGGSGGAGLIAIQLAAQAGAEVTSVSGASGLEAVRAAGAHMAYDYRAKPPLRGPYDLIVNYSGAMPFAAARSWLGPRGLFVEASPNIPKFLGSLIANPFRAQKHLMLQTVAKTADLAYLGGLVASGKVKTEIARVFDLADARSAFEVQEKGGVIGKLVLTTGG